MKLVIEQSDLEGPDAIFDALERYHGHRKGFAHAFAEWWANNHGGKETADFLRCFLLEYEKGPQDLPEKQVVKAANLTAEKS